MEPSALCGSTAAPAESFGKSIRSPGIGFESSEPQLISTTRAIDASCGNDAVALEWGSSAEIVAVGSGSGVEKEARDLIPVEPT
jgi:hypothetical protein